MFIYPDFLTGLKGKFLNGKLQRAREVEVVGERCNHGVKELKLKPPEKKEKHVVWRDSRNLDYGSNPSVMDPFERKSVYVKQSTLPIANEGLFAKKSSFQEN